MGEKGAFWPRDRLDPSSRLVHRVLREGEW